MTPHAFPALAGPRIDLVALDEAGLSDMFEYSRDPRFYEFLEFSPHTTVEETRAYLDKLRARMIGGAAHYWFVRLRQEAKTIGTFGVHTIDWRKGSGELGYGIAPAYWKRGYFAESLELVLDHLFGAAGFHRVSATTPRRNESSIRSLCRAGFVEEGTLRDFYLDGTGRRYDAAVLGIVTADYQRRAAAEGAHGRH